MSYYNLYDEINKISISSGENLQFLNNETILNKIEESPLTLKSAIIANSQPNVIIITFSDYIIDDTIINTDFDAIINSITFKRPLYSNIINGNIELTFRERFKINQIIEITYTNSSNVSTIKNSKRGYINTFISSVINNITEQTTIPPTTAAVTSVAVTTVIPTTATL